MRLCYAGKVTKKAKYCTDVGRAITWPFNLIGKGIYSTEKIMCKKKYKR